ncbi:MAG: class I SAM-dependent methyltransferase [Candidatus Nanopelagicales bacterium]
MVAGLASTCDRQPGSCHPHGFGARHGIARRPLAEETTVTVRVCEVCAGESRLVRLDDQALLSRCAECGHVERDLALAPAYARDVEYGEGPGGTVRIELTYRRLLRRMPELSPPGPILEVGCGPEALLARRLFQAGYNVVGIDPNVSTGEMGGVQLVRAGLDSTTVQVLNGSPGQPSTGYQAATAIHVLEHIGNLRTSLQVLRSQLREHGSLYAITPAGDSSALSRNGSAWWMLEDPTHIRFFSEQSLSIALRRAGFRNIRIRRLITDSMATDSATLIRRIRPRNRPKGVLDQTSTRAISMATLPVALGTRVVSKRWRSVLEVVADN